MKAFLYGLGLGIGLGVLFAPMSGEQARNTLQERAQDLASSARDSFEQGKGRVKRTVSTFRGEGARPTGTEAGV